MEKTWKTKLAFLSFPLLRSCLFHIINYFLQDQNAGKMFADEAAALFERAITTTMKGNMLLYFAYADFEEVV